MIANGSSSPVPVIDLEPFRLGDRLARSAVARAVDAASTEVGFCAVVGHGVAPDLVARMMSVTTAFFDQPAATKQRYVVADKQANRGYAAEGSEALSYSLGTASAPDLFEAFNVGREIGDSDVDDYIAVERHRFFHPNVWPDASIAGLAEMRSTWLEYWDAMEELGFTIMSAMAVALGLADDYFAPLLDRSISVMRAINYERRAAASDPLPGQMRMGAHSDYGSITILLADDVPGLQIRADDGAWTPVSPPAGGFLVNLGDLLSEWTNDRWRSTVHRVVPPPASANGVVRRRSIAWFQQPRYDAVIECLPTCRAAGEGAHHPAITSGDHLISKLMGPRLHRPSDPTPVIA